MQIGKRIKELRETQHLTLTELAQRSGVQIATLSRIENQKMIGTIESHMNISKALGIDLIKLYEGLSPSRLRNTAAGEPQVMETFTYNQKASYEILTSQVLSKKMMPIIMKIEEGGATNSEQNPFGSEKFIFILEGEIEAQAGGKTFSLKANNSLYFDASVPHSFKNTGKGAAKLIVVGTPVNL